MLLRHEALSAQIIWNEFDVLNGVSNSVCLGEVQICESEFKFVYIKVLIEPINTDIPEMKKMLYKTLHFRANLGAFDFWA